MAQPLGGLLRSLDAYPKLLDDFSVRTKHGGLISLVAIVAMLWLFFSNLLLFLDPEVVHELKVDKTLGEQLRINFNVTFPRIPCSILGSDAMDASGEHLNGVEDHIFKTRLDSNGRPFGDATRHKLTEGADTVQSSKQLVPRDKIVAQLKSDGPDEGCIMHGYLEVTKAQGNFHFAPSRAIHNFFNEALSLSFNVSHTVNHLSFGKFVPGMRSPLDGQERIVEVNTGCFMFFVKIIPTKHSYLNGTVILTNQYSVTEHFRPLVFTTFDNIRSQMGGATDLPGVYFYFEMSPLRMQSWYRRRSFSHFVTEICAIIGGVFTVMGMVDSAIDSGLRRLRLDKHNLKR